MPSTLHPLFLLVDLALLSDLLLEGFEVYFVRGDTSLGSNVPNFSLHKYVQQSSQLSKSKRTKASSDGVVIDVIRTSLLVEFSCLELTTHFKKCLKKNK
jgi:hypothetical protein